MPPANCCKHRRLIARIKTVQRTPAAAKQGRQQNQAAGKQSEYRHRQAISELQPASRERKYAKRTAVGVVTSDRMTDTRRVEIPRLVRHPKYGKYLRRRTICYVHDEKNESHMGDTVEIVECRPLSRLKRWDLVRVVSQGSWLA